MKMGTSFWEIGFAFLGTIDSARAINSGVVAINCSDSKTTSGSPSVWTVVAPLPLTVVEGQGRWIVDYDPLVNHSANAALTGDSLIEDDVVQILQWTNGRLGAVSEEVAVAVSETGPSAAHQTLGAVADCNQLETLVIAVIHPFERITSCNSASQIQWNKISF